MGYYGRYTGRIVSMPDGKPYAFVGTDTVRKVDAHTEDVTFAQDIFLHRDECSTPMRIGMEVSFALYSDLKRENAGRAEDAAETTASRLEHVANGGITLALQGLGETNVLQQSSVFATWCITPQLASQMHKLMHEGRTVKLLFVLWPVGAHDDHTEQRLLVDVGDPMTVLPFRRGGHHRIFASFVFHSSEHDLHNAYLSRRDGKYITTIIHPDESALSLDEGGFSVGRFGSGAIDVIVPDELFAAKPRDWELVNWFFPQPPVDQCAFRRRRIVAYPVLIPGILLIAVCWGILSWSASLAVITVLMLCGFRGVNFMPLLHPLDQSPKYVWEDLGSTVFIPKIKGRHLPLPLAVSPFACLVLAGIAAAIVKISKVPNINFLSVFLVLMTALIVIMSIATAVSVWSAGVDWNERENQKIYEARQRIAAEVDRMVCTSTGPRTPNAWELPFGVRTVRFYAHALKQKVCRGFAA